MKRALESSTAISDSLRPSPTISRSSMYAPPRSAQSLRREPLLKLDANEGPTPDKAVLQQLTDLTAEQMRRYPSGAGLESRIADRFGVADDHVLVTAGADDAIDRVCRAMLGPERRAIIMNPTFEMFPRYVRLAHAEAVVVPWLDGEFPISEVRKTTVHPDVSTVFIDSPNNPTGGIVGVDAFLDLASERPDVLFVADLAYVEFADDDPTTALLKLPNIVVTRTFSKAFGLAGLRVGYAIGNERVINWLRAAGHPYPVSSLSLSLAALAFQDSDNRQAAYLQQVREQRRELVDLLSSRNVSVTQSQGNFVLGQFDDAWQIADALLVHGILVRRFEQSGALADRLRITCPGSSTDFSILIAALNQIVPAGGCQS